MNFDELKKDIKMEIDRCEHEIYKVDIEMARLQGKREELHDRKNRLLGLVDDVST